MKKDPHLEALLAGRQEGRLLGIQEGRLDLASETMRWMVEHNDKALMVLALLGLARYLVPPGRLPWGASGGLGEERCPPGSKRPSC